MKTIREIAEEISVSKQAVYKRYKGKLYKCMFPYVRNVSGTIYIMEQGEKIIKQDFLRDSVSIGASEERVLNELVFMLKQELKFKNRQIAELNSIIRTQAKIASRGIKPKPEKRKKPSARRIKSAAIKRLISE